MNKINKPFLRWAGGKRWLAEWLAPYFSGCQGTYYEPFLGSGSMFFAANPRCAFLSDINEELINLYEILRDDPVGLRRYLSRIDVTKENYYKIRSSGGKKGLEAASRTLFLNKTSFNGLYRVNKKGEFNVPFGDRSTEDFLKTDSIERASRALEGVSTVCEDFELAVDRAQLGDVVYCDPAYTVKHDNNGFIRYNESVFSWSDQLRLHDAAIRAVRRGVVVVISNAGHSTIGDLYIPYKPLYVSRRSSIGSVKSRGEVVETVFVLSKRKSDRKVVGELLKPVRFLP